MNRIDVILAEEIAKRLPPQLEIRIGQGETPGYYWVEGWRNGQPKYVRTGNVTSHEAWSYGDAWMRDEMLKNEKEAK